MTSIDAIINRQLLQWEYQRKQTIHGALLPDSKSPTRIVTVSRQRGSRGAYFARRLAEQLDYTCIHREIIDAICESSGYLKRVVGSLDEKFRNDLELMIESLLLGRSVDHHDYIRHLYRVIHSMASLGGVLLIGRGGNFILGPKCGFHIRVVAPFDARVEYLQKYDNLDRDQARKAIEVADFTRHQFVQKLFDKEIDDSINYDLMINTASIDVEDMIRAAAILVNAKFEKQSSSETRKTRA